MHCSNAFGSSTYGAAIAVHVANVATKTAVIEDSIADRMVHAATAVIEEDRITEKAIEMSLIE